MKSILFSKPGKGYFYEIYNNILKSNCYNNFNTHTQSKINNYSIIYKEVIDTYFQLYHFLARKSAEEPKSMPHLRGNDS